MEIALVTVAWEGYGRFIKEWCEYIAKSTAKPNEVVIVLGRGHGFVDEGYCRSLISNLVIIEDNLDNPNVGRLTNLGIENTTSEWVMPFDVDDLLMPDAIETFEKYEKDADYLCIAWKWFYKGKMVYRQSPTPDTIAKMPKYRRSKVRVNNNSPFRRKFWEMQAYDENNYINLQFLPFLVEQGARFVKVPRICISYRQWQGSMYGSETWLQEKPGAIRAVKDMYIRFEKYYGVKK